LTGKVGVAIINQFVVQSDVHSRNVGKETGMSVTNSSLKLPPKPNLEAANANS
jgi:hypothetical protein